MVLLLLRQRLDLLAERGDGGGLRLLFTYAIVRTYVCMYVCMYVRNHFGSSPSLPANLRVMRGGAGLSNAAVFSSRGGGHFREQPLPPLVEQPMRSPVGRRELLAGTAE